ncbi:uncharacterized protein BXZ73DRAFT_73955 [Epithele typhae]|uniref:uncharacterized protein n=1 Tax=Epithele typhae TaxID=378194 RepID=UPI0020083E9B|nr:uncharacterized protein BXZ73DRAFT_73955 [Epithele typhae]KAH9944441.1 hypothetical protein BXZ73DRAFT_73955 [Epithele typhae]
MSQLLSFLRSTAFTFSWPFAARTPHTQPPRFLTLDEGVNTGGGAAGSNDMELDDEPPVRPSDHTRIFVPDGSLAWAAYEDLDPEFTDPILLHESSSCATELGQALIGHRLTQLVRRRWLRDAPSAFVGSYREYLRSMQGAGVPRVINVYDDVNYINLAIVPPHPTLWFNASAVMPHALKRAVIEAYRKLHRAGILHSAVERHNILIGADCRVTLFNFSHSKSTRPVDGLLGRATAKDFQAELREVKYKLDYDGTRARTRYAFRDTSRDPRLIEGRIVNERNGKGDDGYVLHPATGKRWREAFPMEEPARIYVPSRNAEQREDAHREYEEALRRLETRHRDESELPLFVWPLKSRLPAPLAALRERDPQKHQAIPSAKATTRSYSTGSGPLPQASPCDSPPAEIKVRDFVSESYTGPRGFYVPHPPTEALSSLIRVAHIRNENALACGAEGLDTYWRGDAHAHAPSSGFSRPGGHGDDHISRGHLKRRREAALRGYPLTASEEREAKRRRVEDERRASLRESPDRPVRFLDIPMPPAPPVPQEMRFVEVGVEPKPRAQSHRGRTADLDVRSTGADDGQAEAPRHRFAWLPRPIFPHRIPGAVRKGSLKRTRPVREVSYDLRTWQPRRLAEEAASDERPCLCVTEDGFPRCVREHSGFSSDEDEDLDDVVAAAVEEAAREDREDTPFPDFGMLGAGSTSRRSARLAQKTARTSSAKGKQRAANGKRKAPDDASDLNPAPTRRPRLSSSAPEAGPSSHRGPSSFHRASPDASGSGTSTSQGTSVAASSSGGSKTNTRTRGSSSSRRRSVRFASPDPIPASSQAGHCHRSASQTTSSASSSTAGPSTRPLGSNAERDSARGSQGMSRMNSFRGRARSGPSAAPAHRSDYDSDLEPAPSATPAQHSPAVRENARFLEAGAGTRVAPMTSGPDTDVDMVDSMPLTTVDDIMEDVASRMWMDTQKRRATSITHWLAHGGFEDFPIHD